MTCEMTCICKRQAKASSPKHAPGKGSKPLPAAKPSNLSPNHQPPAVHVAQATPPEVESWQAEDDQVRKKVL